MTKHSFMLASLDIFKTVSQIPTLFPWHPIPDLLLNSCILIHSFSFDISALKVSYWRLWRRCCITDSKILDSIDFKKPSSSKDFDDQTISFIRSFCSCHWFDITSEIWSIWVAASRLKPNRNFDMNFTSDSENIPWYDYYDMNANGIMPSFNKTVIFTFYQIKWFCEKFR